MNKNARTLIPVAALMCALAQHPVPALGESATQMDPSARAAGMGGVSTAVFWPGDLNDWANPALLGYGEGLSYRWSHTDFEHGATVGGNRFSYQWSGLGLDVGRLRLDYGESGLTSGSGDPIGGFSASEQVDAIRGGVSISRLVRNIASLRGTDAPRFTRYADIAFGFARKPVEIHIADAGLPARHASTEANDAGLLIRVSPIVEGDAGGPFLDLAYGYAALNYNDAPVTYIGDDITFYIERQYRNGFALRFGLSPSPEAATGLQRRFGLIGEGMNPLLSIALAADFSHFQPGPYAASYHDVDALGLEVQFVNVLALRIGHVTDEASDINGYSWGLGVGIPFGDIGAVRYDYARDPKPGPDGGFAPTRHGLLLTIDPLAIARR